MCALYRPILFGKGTSATPPYYQTLSRVPRSPAAPPLLVRRGTGSVCLVVRLVPEDTLRAVSPRQRSGLRPAAVPVTSSMDRCSDLLGGTSQKKGVSDIGRRRRGEEKKLGLIPQIARQRILNFREV